MTQDEIIRMAREAGNEDEDWLVLTRQLFKHFPKEMERFANLIAEATKEKAAKVCEEHDTLIIEEDGSAWPCDQFHCAAAIRSMK